MPNLYKNSGVRNNDRKMKKLMPNQQGFIPLMITIVLIIAIVIYLCYKVVLKHQH